MEFSFLFIAIIVGNENISQKFTIFAEILSFYGFQSEETKNS